MLRILFILRQWRAINGKLTNTLAHLLNDKSVDAGEAADNGKFLIRILINLTNMLMVKIVCQYCSKAEALIFQLVELYSFHSKLSGPRNAKWEVGGIPMFGQIKFSSSINSNYFELQPQFRSKYRGLIEIFFDWWR